MFYVVRVNSALAQLGIDPTSINQDYRQTMQIAGKSSGASPQEVALFIASQLPIIYHPNINFAAIRTWARKNKIDPRIDEVKEALYTLNLGELAD